MRIELESAPASVSFGGGAPLALIAGCCVIETGEHTLWLARAIREAVGPFVSNALRLDRLPLLWRRLSAIAGLVREDLFVHG